MIQGHEFSACTVRIFRPHAVGCRGTGWTFEDWNHGRTKFARHRPEWINKHEYDFTGDGNGPLYYGQYTQLSLSLLSVFLPVVSETNHQTISISSRKKH